MLRVTLLPVVRGIVEYGSVLHQGIGATPIHVDGIHHTMSDEEVCKLIEVSPRGQR